ncbi:MAG: efflux RND transporter permease subunit [Kiritimatiellia bacterium]
MLISNYAIKFRTAVFAFLVVLVIAGASAYKNLPREGSPDITIPYVYLTAIYEGTAPSEMEKLVTIPLEKQLNDLENVKEITSTSYEGVSSIAIEFLSGQDMDLALQRVKNKIDLARPDLPTDLDEPVAQAINFSTDFPILLFTLSGNTPLDRLKNLAEDLQDRIEQLPGVKQAAVSGIREREIRVEIDISRLASFGIPMDLVMQRIASENRTISAGNLETRGDKFQVRIPGEFEIVPQIRELMLAERNGKPVFLRDIATITDTYKDLSSISRINRKPSVSISLMKRSGENSVKVIDRVKELLDAYALPPGIELTIVMDESDYVRMMIEELENNIASGFILVVVVLLIFMGWRNAFFVGLAIPFSMLLGFAIISAMGMTLNMIVLFSLVLAVGMLVDNAIVIVENIYRNRTLGLSRHEAARRGASEVAWPVITSTLTTLAAFCPLLFWPDIMGQFMGFLPRTLIIVLSASLFVAIVINPAICSALISARKREARPHKHWFVQGYERLLRFALANRLAVLALGFAFLILSIQLYARFGSGQELFPDVEPRSATIGVKFPEGTSIERTDAALASIEEKLTKYEDIKFCLATVGSAGGGTIEGGQGGTHLGNIHVEFVSAQDRTGNTFDLITEIRKDIGLIPGAEVTVAKQEEGPPLGNPVEIEFSGDDFETLAEYAAEIMHRIETVPGLVELRDDMEDALPEIQFVVDRDRAALFGLDTSQIGNFLRTAVYGTESSKFRADEDEYDITLRLPEDQRNTLALLDRIFIPAPGGQKVPLTSLGKVEYTGGKGAIKRKNQKRVIKIIGDNQNRGVDEILVDVQARLADMILPRGYSIKYAGDTEEMQESGAFLSRAFVIASGLIAVILVIQFNSILLPFIIMFTVLLSLIGVMWGLLLCRMKFGIIMTGLGVISLAGIVVNNAIVLIDCILQRRAEGLEIHEAIVSAGTMRLRPVLLTAVTTILGLLPMAIGYSVEFHQWPPRIIAGAESTQWWAPMAVAVLFGLLLSTILTLVLVPSMYSTVESIAAYFRKRFGVKEE